MYTTGEVLMNWYCNGSSFNLVKSFNTNPAVFSACEINTILYLPLVIYIILYTPIRVVHLLLKRETHSYQLSPNNLIFTLQLLSLTSLLLISLYQLLLHLSSRNWSIENDSPVILLTSVYKVATFTIALTFSVWNRCSSICSSTSICVVSLYYLISSTFHLVLSFTQSSTFPLNDLYLIYCQFALAFINLLCHLFSASRSATFVDEKAGTQSAHPVVTASSFSKITYQWVDSLVIRGYRKGTLTNDDLYIIRPKHRARQIHAYISKIWAKQTVSPVDGSVKGGNVFATLLRAYGKIYFKASISNILLDGCVLLTPVILKMLLKHLEDTQAVIEWHGYLMVVALFTTITTQSLLQNFFYYRMLSLGVMVRSSLVSMIYRKSLKITNASRSKSTTGEIVNLMAVDADRFTTFLRYGETIWSGPIRIVVSIYFLYQDLGYAIFAGVGVMVLLIPVTTLISKYMQRIQSGQMKKKDERIKLINEILSGIKVIKLYAWEKSFAQLVDDIRAVELNRLRKMAYSRAVTSFLFTSTPMAVAMLTFLTYILLDSSHHLNAQKAFVSLAYFNIIRMPLTNLPQMFIQLILVRVSVKRINKFLNLPELEEYITRKKDDFTVRMTGCDFVHEVMPEEEKKVANGTQVSNGHAAQSEPTVEPFALKNINMTIKEGSFVAIVGTVGSGKSSLVSALLGEMEKTSGTVNIAPNSLTGEASSIAYVPQQAWIQNNTLRNNILFGESWSESKYRRIISACQLAPDLEILPSGDSTEIGEKGINLSGGQKQRLSLARACYTDADLYVLDDPLSAVDAHVSKALYNQVLSTKTGLLGDKTRILVTNDLSLLPKVDHIYVVANGTISESGQYDDLMSSQGAFSRFVEEFSNKERSASVASSASSANGSAGRSTSQSSGLKEKPASEDAPAKLIEDETMNTGRVKFSVYISYVKKISLVSVFVMFILSMQSFEAGANYWLSLWASDGNDTSTELTTLRLSVYAGMGIGQVFSIVTAALVFARGSIVCSSKMHSQLFQGIIRAPMSFFDTTPLGRIVNRFSKDIDVVDESLPNYFFYWVQIAVQSAAVFIVVISVTPWFALLILPIAVVYFLIQKIYIPTNRQLRRMVSVTRSPLYSNFSETLSGVATILAYDAQERFIADSDVKLDTTQRASFCSTFTDCWLSIRLQFMGNCIVVAAALFAVLDRTTISPALAGLSVTYASSITQMMTWLVMISAALETDIVAVERILEYTELKPEAEWTSQDVTLKPPAEWPATGTLQFKSYSTRYRENLPLVLKDVALHIASGEHIGIVGRTGAGKSSITLALFRLIEPANGTIIIDGVDTSKIGLHELREAITIIPQDPILFSGKLRMNLDPFNKFSDDQLWRSLESAHLKDFVSGLDGSLDYVISEGGSNLSVGQRQLICLARALLKKTKILILDEATAAVDLQTDSLIQSTVRSEFSSCTILTIAHRLNTIMDSDRILVLDRGEVVEFASPKKLLQDVESTFYSLAKDAGIV